MKFSMAGQEMVTFKFRWLLNRGDHMGRFDCTLLPVWNDQSLCIIHSKIWYSKTCL